MIIRGCPEYLRSDNGSEFNANKLRKWLSAVGVITAYIEPGSPWENGYCESFNARMRDEFLNGEIFGNMYEAQVLTRRWVLYYNTIRPHSSLVADHLRPKQLFLFQRRYHECSRLDMGPYVGCFNGSRAVAN